MFNSMRLGAVATGGIDRFVSVLPSGAGLSPWRVAACQSGLASGLALAVRPAGSALGSGAQGRVLKIVSAKRLETIFGCP
jgi:hypothetical protein